MTRHGWAVAVLVGATSLALAGGVKRASTPVPPTQELELLDPNVDPTGKPAVIVRPNPLGGQLIDIPPTILVHRFYYTGDRSFQGPMLPGGPMIVVASHPKTFERVYVPVMLPPGAPRVFYTPSTIRYDFGPQSVTLAVHPLRAAEGPVLAVHRPRDQLPGVGGGGGRAGAGLPRADGPAGRHPEGARGVAGTGRQRRGPHQRPGQGGGRAGREGGPVRDADVQDVGRGEGGPRAGPAPEAGRGADQRP